MKKLSLRTKSQKQYLEIPVDFIDEYMPQAPEGAFKVYLYLMRCSLDPSILLSLSDMADLFDVTQKAIIRSLTYWEDCGLLTLEYSGDELTDITLLPFPGDQGSSMLENRYDVPDKAPESSVIPMPSDPEPQPAKEGIFAEPKHSIVYLNPSFSGSIVDLSNDEEFADFLKVTERYFADNDKHITSTMVETLEYCYLLFDRQIEIVTFLVEYCVESKHFSKDYIRTVAENWKKNSLTTLAKIKEDVESKKVSKILSAYGIKGRVFSSSEMKYVDAWRRQFDLPVILEACKRTIDNIHEPSLKYTDRILTDWKENNVRSLKDIQALDQTYARKEKAKKLAQSKSGKYNSFQNFQGREENYDDLIKDYYES